MLIKLTLYFSPFSWFFTGPISAEHHGHCSSIKLNDINSIPKIMPKQIFLGLKKYPHDFLIELFSLNSRSSKADFFKVGIQFNLVYNRIQFGV